MSEKLKITKGVWRVQKSIIDESENIAIKSENLFTVSDINGVVTAICGRDELASSEANARLIADAGTTYNKCSLLPSELLERNNELVEFLIDISKNYLTAHVPEKVFDKIDYLINKSTL